jgi:hypothetical protein
VIKHSTVLFVVVTETSGCAVIKHSTVLFVVVTETSGFHRPINFWRYWEKVYESMARYLPEMCEPSIVEGSRNKKKNFWSM